ncbi:MAG: hypothetical protein Q9222_005586 [Ikaeria aurantiellina]
MSIDKAELGDTHMGDPFVFPSVPPGYSEANIGLLRQRLNRAENEVLNRRSEIITDPTLLLEIALVRTWVA